MARFREKDELTSPWVRIPDTRNYSGKRKMTGKENRRYSHRSIGTGFVAFLLMPVSLIAMAL